MAGDNQPTAAPLISLLVGPQRPGGSGGYWAVVVLFVIGLFAVGAFILYKFKR